MLRGAFPGGEITGRVVSYIMHKLIALIALFSVGCLAQVEEPPPADDCPAVACGWEPNETTCLSEANVYSAQTRYEEPDEFTACWMHEAVCVPKGTRAECVPDECRRTIGECQPMGEARIGRP